MGIAARVAKAGGRVSLVRVGVTGLASKAYRAANVETLLAGKGYRAAATVASLRDDALPNRPIDQP